MAPLTFGAEAQSRRQSAIRKVVTVRIGIAHRYDSEIAHDNTGVLDASVSFAPSASFAAYGRNLLGEVFRRSHFDLTGPVDSTYSPLKDRRVLGIEARWEFR